MSAYKGQSRRIRDALIQVVAAIQLDGGSGPEPAFVNVLPNTRQAFAGYPSVRVLPTDQENQRASVKSNEREPSFSLWLHVPMEDNADGETAAYNQILDRADLIIDTLTQGEDYVGDEQSPLSAVDSSINDYQLAIERGTYLVQGSGAGTILLNEIVVTVTYSKDSV